MKCVIARNPLLAALQRVVGVVDKRHIQPILSHVLLNVHSHHIECVGTDSDMTLSTKIALSDAAEIGAVTVSVRKLIDVCRTLPDDSIITLEETDNHVTLKTGHSELVLRTLPAASFPSTDSQPASVEFCVTQSLLRDLLERSYFSMASQDVRYYLNGMLWQIDKNELRVACTDGHRLALCSADCDTNQTHAVIVPRKAVLELMRLLDDIDDALTISLDDKSLQVTSGDFSFRTKLIEGRFPDLAGVLPQSDQPPLVLSRQSFKQSLQHVAILSSDKYNGVRMQLEKNKLQLSIKSPEQEQVHTQMDVDYQGAEVDMGFNVNYLIDVCNNLSCESLTLSFSAGSSNLLIQPEQNERCQYVVMSMRL